MPSFKWLTAVSVAINNALPLNAQSPKKVASHRNGIAARPYGIGIGPALPMGSSASIDVYANVKTRGSERHHGLT